MTSFNQHLTDAYVSTKRLENAIWQCMMADSTNKGDFIPPSFPTYPHTLLKDIERHINDYLAQQKATAVTHLTAEETNHD